MNGIFAPKQRRSFLSELIHSHASSAICELSSIREADHSLSGAHVGMLRSCHG